MNTKKRKIIKRVSIWTAVVLFILVVLPSLLYIPYVQNLVKDIVAEQVSEATGWNVTIDKFYLRFPLEVEVRKALVLDEKKDTLMAAGLVKANVNVLPLFIKRIEVNNASLEDGFYRMVPEDSTMFLKGKISSCQLKRVAVDLGRNSIILDKGDISGGDVSLLFDNDKVKKEESEDPTEEFWKIKIKEVNINNLHYAMQMLPVIYNLDATIAKGVLKKGIVNTEDCTVDAEYLGIDGVRAVYLTPTPEYIASHPVEEVPADSLETVSKEWTVTGNLVSLKNANGIYAVSGAEPMPGIDFNYLEGKNINIEIENLFNRGAAIRVPIKSFTASERCGLSIIEGRGTFEMDSTGMSVDDFEMLTDDSRITVDGKIDNGIFEVNNNARLDFYTSSDISVKDFNKLYPSINGFDMPAGVNNLLIDGDVNGTLGNLKIEKMMLNAPNLGDISMTGNAVDVLSNNPKAHLDLDGNFTQLNYLRPLLGEGMQDVVSFPEFSINGTAEVNGATYVADLALLTETGSMTLEGNMNARKEVYDIKFLSQDFPLNEFLPTSGLGLMSLSLNAAGSGFNIFKAGSMFNCELMLSNLIYKNRVIRNIDSKTTVDNGVLDFSLDSDNKYLSFHSAIKSTLLNDNYEYSVNTDFRNVDLHRIGLSDVPFNLKGQLVSSGLVDLANDKYDCVALIDNYKVDFDKYKLRIPTATSFVYSDCDSLAIGFNEGDFNGNVYVSCSLDTLMSRFGEIADVLGTHLENRTVNFEDINKILPRFDAFVKMREDNVVNSFLTQSGMGLKSLNLIFNRDSLLNMRASILGFKINETYLDTLTMNANQKGDSLKYIFHMGNISGNLDQFSNFDLNGYVGSNKLQALYHQRDVKDNTSFKLGVNAMLTKEALYVNLFPEDPVIGYRKWSIPSDNYLKYIPAKRYFDANVKLSNENGYISLLTEHSADSVDLSMKFDIRGLKLGEWINVAPYAPKLRGDVNASATFAYIDSKYKGYGYFGINDFTYNKGHLGDLKFDLDMDVNPQTKQNEATASLSVDGRKSMILRGVVNDTTTNKPFDFSLKLDRLPTSLANPFLPKNMAVMGGYLNGDMSMFKCDSLENVVLDGYIACDSTTLNMPIFGSKLKFSDNPVKVDSNKIVFKDFGVSGSNNSPLRVNGKVNIENLISPDIDLDIKGKNVQLIDSKHTSKSQIFGKGFVNVDAKAKGKLSHLIVDAKLAVLPETNATYVLQTDVSAVSQQQQVEGLVKFVNFNDTTTVKDTVPPESLFGLDLNADLNIAQGSVLSVNLSPEGKNKVEIQGNGNLTYKMNSLGDSRLSGRFNLNDGFVRYYPPLISEKYFKFVQGSYLSWTGDMMNPMLNLKATSNQTSTVVSDGSNPTRVNFLITALVTNTLNNMNVTFDLSSNNSMIDSELKSMTPAQRSAQAINLMLYNSYTGSSASTASAPNTNMLYSVLSSRLNNLASSVVKGVDISFGINEYNMANGSGAGTGMNYSYQISKSLFNNRFKMTVGGNYDTGSTNSSGSDVAQNLFNNVSFEYNITPSGNMSIKIYNKLTDNNIYQTQVNETGVAFVMRRRLMTLKDLFKFNFVNKFMKKEKEPQIEKEEEVDEKK